MSYAYGGFSSSNGSHSSRVKGIEGGVAH
jgi:hypothetical protein